WHRESRPSRLPLCGGYSSSALTSPHFVHRLLSVCCSRSSRVGMVVSFGVFLLTVYQRIHARVELLDAPIVVQCSMCELHWDTDFGLVGVRGSDARSLNPHEGESATSQGDGFVSIPHVAHHHGAVRQCVQLAHGVIHPHRFA